MSKIIEYVKTKLDKAQIKYTIHNSNTHIKINDDIHFYPTTGRFVINKRTYEPHFIKEKKSIKEQIKLFIRMMRSDNEPSLDAPNPWSTGLAVPYSVAFHFLDGSIEFVNTEIKQ